MTDAPTNAGGPDAYRQFLDDVKRHANLQAAEDVLEWDQEVVMPEEGTPARSSQRSVLSEASHDVLTGDGMADHLAALADADLDDEQRAVVREMRRKHERAVAVPADLVQRISRATAEAHPTWKQAREADEFEAFAETLAELVTLRREYAEHIDPTRDPYAVLFEEYEPYLGLETAERVLDRLREELPPLIANLRAADAELAAPFEGTFDVDAQERLVRDVLSELGYDWDRGRLDTAPHPFSSGNQFDARVTTSFDEADPTRTIGWSVHEFGHAFYTQGLPDGAYGTPLGASQGQTVHESQSRLWENHVGRTEAFWEQFLPTAKGYFPQLSGTTPRELYEAANRIHPDNVIRSRADELTYHMHVVLRFEIERDLVSGDLDVREVPAVWNDKMERYLGVRPDSDADGCLQDIHWSRGIFGYFPTYSLGSVLAAQLYEAAVADVGPLEERIRTGNFGPLADWLRENVHRHGQRYETDQLVREATGEPYTADYFVEYAKRKFGELYGI